MTESYNPYPELNKIHHEEIKQNSDQFRNFAPFEIEEGANRSQLSPIKPRIIDYNTQQNSATPVHKI